MWTHRSSRHTCVRIAKCQRTIMCVRENTILHNIVAYIDVLHRPHEFCRHRCWCRYTAVVVSSCIWHGGNERNNILYRNSSSNNVILCICDARRNRTRTHRKRSIISPSSSSDSFLFFIRRKSRERWTKAHGRKKKKTNIIEKEHYRKYTKEETNKIERTWSRHRIAQITTTNSHTNQLQS